MPDEALIVEFFAAVKASDSVRVADFLKEDRALLEARDYIGHTPLMQCVGSTDRTLECFQYLLNAGANVNAVSPEGYTPLLCIIDVSWADPEISTRMLRDLVAAGADLEARQHWGWTPLMRAVLEGSTDEIDTLLDLGADPNQVFPQDSRPPYLQGRTLLSGALPNAIQMSLLIRAGADISAEDTYGQTVREYAQEWLNEATYEDDRARIGECISALDELQP